MLEGVTIEQLRTLRAVADEGSFSAAARKLGRVQAAVSQAIDRLEAQLGLRLFDRSGRVPRLTRHGEAIVSAAARIDGEVESLDELVQSLKRGEERMLSIVVDVLFPTAGLVAFARDFARAHPGVELLLFNEVLSGVTAHVREKRSSFGIALEDADLNQLEHRRIADVQLIPVAAPEFTPTRDAVQIVLGAAGGEDQGVFSARTWRVVDLATKHALILGGLGFGHMPEHLVRADLDANRLVPLRLDAWGDRPPRRTLVLVTRPGAPAGPVAKWAQDHLSKLCREVVSHET